MIRLRVQVWCAVLLLATAVLHAQVAGKVTGSVVDPTGAAVPEATVSLQLPGSGSSVFSTRTSAAGDFVMLAVPANTYDLVVESSGFLKAIVGGLKVDPNRATDVPAIKLTVAGVTQTVEVTEATQSVQTSNAEVATTIAKSQIANLPVINRSPLAFVQTQAGVNSGRGNTTVNGQRPWYVNVTVDGINVQDNYIRNNDVDFLPNYLELDQVAEVTVSTSNSNAATFGGSAQISFVTPSGTNNFHGNGYWSNRNNYFASNTWFNNQSGTASPFLNQNQLGGSISGPVIHNRLFFNGHYEAFRLRRQQSTNLTVLTTDARNGIYTYKDSGGNLQKVNILQAAGVPQDAAMAKILAKVPDASHINNYSLGDSTSALLRNTAGDRFNQRYNETRDNVMGKVDFLASTKNTITGTYMWNHDVLDRPDADVTFDVVPSVLQKAPSSFLSTAWRFNPGATFTNEVRFGFNKASVNFLAGQDMPSYFAAGMTFSNPVNTFRSQGRYIDTFNYADNASWIHDKHTLQAGFQGQSVLIHSYNDAAITPTFTLGISSANTNGLTSTQLPGISASDLSAANLLLASLGGYISSYSQQFNVASKTSGFVNGQTNDKHYKYSDYALYLQDSWKLSRRLTANLGVRWDYLTPFSETNGLALFPVLQNNNPLQTLLNPNATLDFVGSSWYKADKNNFAPNVGLAWDVFGDGKTSVRAGYSISYVTDLIVQAMSNSATTNAGLQSTVSAAGLTSRISTNLPVIASPTFKVPRTLADNYALSSSSAAGMPDPGLVTPYVQQWNLGIQRAIKNNIIEVRYVGNHGTKEIRGLDYNQVMIDGILPDFLRAQSNGVLAQKAGGSYNPTYNPNIAGSQPLPFFALLPNGGNLTTSTNINYLQTGQVAEMASNYQTTRANGPVSFYLNPNVLGANMLTNYSNSTYHGLQVDFTHRFSHGFTFQTNYVFSRLLSDSQSASSNQTDFEPLLDNKNPKIERSRPADYDLTHVFKLNGTFQLPFGKGHHFAPSNSTLNKVVEGWNIATILTMQSGSPFGVYSVRGTLNRAARSTYNTVNTTLDKSQLDQLFQLRMTGNGPMFVPDSAKNPTDGRAVAPDGSAPFAGQVFFEPAAGTLGTLQRNYFSGPSVWDVDANVRKEIHFTEKQRLELRMDAINVFNHPSFYIGDQTVTSTTFGKITSTFYGRRTVQFALTYRF